MNSYFTRRSAIICGTFATLLPWDSLAFGQDPSNMDSILTDDEPLGVMGEFDANYLGPAESRAARDRFVFPHDADSLTAYGIDISHHTESVPWAALKEARVNYVYMKASQALKWDGKFADHWQAAKRHAMPRGAYHWLTPGLSGKDQGEYLVGRIKAAGGLEKGDLQPVIDLEWDYLGKTFKRQKETRKIGKRQVTTFKDYWSDLSLQATLDTITTCVAAIKAGFPDLNVAPIVYTNRSWWDERLNPQVRLGCRVWPSDYRQKSYDAHEPRPVLNHTYNMWQFTEKGMIVVGNDRYGPFDCNKIVKGTIVDLTIA